MRKHILSALLLSISFFFATAQIPMDSWRTHFAYNNVSQITQSANKVYAVSDGSLFSVNKLDGSVEFYSKLSGLNGSSISKIKYDEVNNKLLIIYSDGNIDIMSESGVFNLPDFNTKQMSADKNVNDVFIGNGNAYLSCNFGIVTINLSKQEIHDTYYIGTNASEVKVLNTTIFNNQIFASTASDIYKADLNDPFLISYEHWSKLTNLPGNGSIQSINTFNNNLVLLRNGKLYKWNSAGTWENIDINKTYSEIVVSGDYLLAFTSAGNYLFDKQLNPITLTTQLSVINDGLYDAKAGNFWLAVGTKGVAQYKLGTETPNYFKPEGPAVNSPYEMKFSGEKLFVLQGEKWVGPTLKDTAYVMIFENNKWTNTNLSSQLNKQLGIKVTDFTSIAVDPDDNKHYYISGASTGIYEFKNDVFFKYYDRKNSNIETALNLADYFYQWVDNVILDKNKNLWFTNDLVQGSIKVYMPASDKWVKLNFNGLSNKQSLGKILISSLNPNQKWVLSRRNLQGICIFDDKGTIDNAQDDDSRFFSSFDDDNSETGGKIIPNFYYCLAQDNDGVIWVGTDKGPLLFTNPNKAFDTSVKFNCTRVKIPRNDGTNLADYLLENERIKVITIDGANRKWIGTESSGVYLMSENGQQTIHHFTSQNSPLLSDNIMSIAINPASGEVFIGTTSGLVSFQSDAAEGKGQFSNVHAYPNPVRENFTGIITITGLVDKTNVKITDLSGNLVCQTVSNGSIATWDGKNVYGKKVSTGVYLALCISPDGSESTTTKILVIN